MEPVGDASRDRDSCDRWVVDGGGVEDDQVGLVAAVVVGETDEPVLLCSPTVVP